MGFRINTNIAAMNAHTAAQMNNRSLDNSLSKLSSGLRINTAADDASGMSIADGLRSQASALGQAIANANDGISMIQIADKAMDEQLKILDTIKVKATQAAQDGQTTQTRNALQADIKRLMESLDNIASTTTFNGQNLLAGSFTNKEFQIGAYSNQSVTASIGATSSDKIGNARFETSANISASGVNALTFYNVDGVNDFTLESVVISSSAGTGIGVMAEAINKNSNMLGGIKASYQVVTTGSSAISAGSVSNLVINNVTIGDISDVKANDSDGRLVAAINNFKDTTGVEASTDSRGHLVLSSRDGRGIELSTGETGQSGSFSFDASGMYVGTTNGTYGNAGVVVSSGFSLTVNGVTYTTSSDLSTVAGSGSGGFSEFDNWITDNGVPIATAPSAGVAMVINGLAFSSATIRAQGNELTTIFGLVDGGMMTLSSATASSGLLNIDSSELNNYGRLTLTRAGAADIIVSSSGLMLNAINSSAEATTNLRSIGGQFDKDVASAMGFNANLRAENISNNRGAGVTTLRGAMAVMTIADSAIQRLDQIRSDLGSVQNAMISTVNNISVTQVNVKAAESQIRDVDFAAESANFSKFNILAQSGSYAMSQANSVQQNVLRLLQ